MNLLFNNLQFRSQIKLKKNHLALLIIKEQKLYLCQSENKSTKNTTKLMILDHPYPPSISKSESYLILVKEKLENYKI